MRSVCLAGAGVVTGPMLNLGRCRLVADRGVEIPTRVVDLVRETTVVDMLSLLTLDWQKLFAWQRGTAPFTEADFSGLARGAIDVFHPAVDTHDPQPHAAALKWLAGWDRMLTPGGCFLARIDSIAEIAAAAASRRIGVVVGFQDSTHFRSVDDVALFYRLGQRVSQLTYNEHNRLGSGCYQSIDRGLTPFGGEIVAAMNEVGMAIDLSHCGERTTLDAIAASRRPVLVTHSNCRALVPGQPRTKSDTVIRRLAAAGGVMGITILRNLVGRRTDPTLEDLLDHFEHVARLVGIEHVGLGSDVDVAAVHPATGRLHPFYALRGLDPVLRVYQIADGLLGRGYSDKDVAGVLGGNFRRVLREVWRKTPQPDTRELERDPFCPVLRIQAPG